MHVLVSSLSLSSRDCLLRATNACFRPLVMASRHPIICCAPRMHGFVPSLLPFAARFCVSRHEYMFSSLFTASRATLVCCAPRVRVGERRFRQNAPHLSGFLDAYDHRPLSMTESPGVYGLTCRFEALGFTILRSRSSVSGKCRTSKNKTAA